jgi:hypothetical protein
VVLDGTQSAAQDHAEYALESETQSLGVLSTQLLDNEAADKAARQIKGTIPRVNLDGRNQKKKRFPALT